MQVKYYNDEIKEENFGILLDGDDAGKLSYIVDPSIKSVEINGKWEPNAGYDIEKAIAPIISVKEGQIIQKTLEKEKATELEFSNKATEIQSEIDELTSEKNTLEEYKV